MIPYSLHVAILLAVCLLFYKLLLQKETYYRLNRVVLLTCLALAFTLPLIPVPRKFSLQAEPVPLAVAPSQEAFTPLPEPPVNNFPEVPATKANAVKTQTAAPVAIAQAKPIVAAAQTTVAPVQKPAPALTSLIPMLIKWAFLAYWCGVAVFGINLLIQIMALLLQSFKKPSIKDGIFRIVELDTDKAPCSFGKSIFINPEKYDWETYNQILLHEKVHIQQGHSFDLILAELMLVLQWFNPFAWLYRKELESNLEFLTDDSVLHDHQVAPEDYQMSLLKVSIPNFSMRITTNYNQSLLKKRIVMMNAKKSNIHTMWKYFMLMPLLAVLVCGLNKPMAAVAQQVSYTSIRGMKSDIDFSHGTWYANIKNDRIYIEFRADDNDENHNWTSSHTFDLKDFPNLPKGDKADFTLAREAGTVVFNGKFDGDQGLGHYKFTVNADYKAFVAKQKMDDIDSDDDYFSFFLANVTKSYFEFLANNGFKDLRKGQIISMAYQKIDAAYIKSWSDLGYKDLSPNQLTALKSLKVDAAYVNDLKKAGYADLTVQNLISLKSQHVTVDYINGLKKATVNVKGAPELTVQNIISSKAQHVDSAYIAGFANTSYSVSNYNQLGSLKSQNITPEFIKSFEAVGLTNLTPGELFTIKNENITPEYVKQFKDMGYTDEDIKRLLPMKRNGITPEYVKSFTAAGLTNLKPNEILGFKSQNITPEYVKQFKDLGYSIDDIKRLVSLKGVTPEYIKGLEAVGYKTVPINTVYGLTAAKVTPEDVKSYVALGYSPVDVVVSGNAVTYSSGQGGNPAVYTTGQFNDRQLGKTDRQLTRVDANVHGLTLAEAGNLKRQGVTPDFVKSFQDLGYKDVPLTTYSTLKSMGITPELVKSFQSAGIKDIPANELYILKSVTPEYIKSMQDAGYKDLSISRYAALKHMDITPEFVNGFTKLGFTNIPLSQLSGIKNSGLTPEFVSEMKQKGFDSKDLQKYVQLKNFNSDADIRNGQGQKIPRAMSTGGNNK